MPELCTSDGARLAPPSDCKASFSRRRARSVGVFVLVDHIGVWLCCLAAAVGSAQCRQTTLFPLCISAYSDLNPCVHGDHEPPGLDARAGGGWSELLGSERTSLATSGDRPKDRKHVVEGNRWSVRVHLGCHRKIKTKKKK